MRRWGRGQQNGPLSKEPEAESNLKLWKSRKVRVAEAWREEERVRRGDGRRHLPYPKPRDSPYVQAWAWLLGWMLGSWTS